jgi:RecJ-like exonuclease
MNTGNSVVDYRWYMKECEVCGGQGFVYAYTKDNAKRIIRNNAGNCEYVKALYREYIKTGKFVCPVCDGVGRVEVWC